MSAPASRARTAAVPAAHVIDRHVLASNVSTFDTAWRTFGWTPAIAGQRAGRLEESVPWATLAATAEAPGRLHGPAGAVLAAENLDRLRFAFLPLDGRLGFSVWGALRRDANGAGWRVLTHTLLFDRPAFDAMAGNPLALLTDAECGEWFRVMVERATFDTAGALEPVRVPDDRGTRTRFELARVREIERLRDRLCTRQQQDAAAMEETLAAVYEGLAAAAVGAVRHVALRGDGPAAPLLAQLAWLSLPLEERASISYSTEQRRAEKPAATLIVLPRSEWGDAVPAATRLIGAAPGQPPASAGRRLWARAVMAASPPQHERGRDNGVAGRRNGEVRRGSSYATLCAQADVRGWRVIARDDLARMEPLHAWRARTREHGLDLDDARRLIEIETRAAQPSVRWRALGHVVGCAARGTAGEPWQRAAVAAGLLGSLAPERAAGPVRAAVRALSRGGVADRQAAGFLRLIAARPERRLTAVDELLRLLGEERAVVDDLVRHGDGPFALFEGAAALALAHPAPAARLMRAATARAADLESVIRAADDPLLVRADLLARLTEAVERVAEGSGADAQRVTRLLLTRVLDAVDGDLLADAQVESVLRLSWIELTCGRGPTSVERHGAAHPRAAIPLLAQLLVSSPPLPLFLRLRRMLLSVPATHFTGRSDLERFRPRLAQYCPALAERVEPAGAGAGAPVPSAVVA